MRSSARCASELTRCLPRKPVSRRSTAETERRVPAMNSLPVFHPAIRVVAAFWFFLASVLPAIDGRALSHLRADIGPQRAQVAALEAKLIAIERELSDLTQRPAGLSETRFLASQRATDAHIVRLEEVLASTARREDLADWQERLAAT